MDGAGLLVVIDMLGNTIAQLRQRVAELESEIRMLREQAKAKD